MDRLKAEANQLGLIDLEAMAQEIQEASDKAAEEQSAKTDGQPKNPIIEMLEELLGGDLGKLTENFDVPPQEPKE